MNNGSNNSGNNNNSYNSNMINSPIPESIKSHSQYQGQSENGINDGGGVINEESGIHDNERTPLISRQDSQDYMSHGKSTVKQTVFNAVVLYKKIFSFSKIFKLILKIHNSLIFFNFFFFHQNVLMGMAILSLPFAFKYAGWFFGILIFLFCLIQTNYTAKIIKKCLDTDPECLTYDDIAHLAFGNKGRLIIGGVFLMDLFNAS
jgi:hypothetical protein